MQNLFPTAPTILFHGGMDELTQEIQIIQPDSNASTSILVDPGFDLQRKAEINDPFHSTAYASAIVHLLTGNLIPRVPGLWNPKLPGFPTTISAALQLLSASGNFTPRQIEREEQLMMTHHNLHEEHKILATQPHLDSVGALPYLRPELALTASPATIAMLKAWETQFPAPGHEFTFITERYSQKEHNKYPRIERPLHEVEPGLPFDLGVFKNILLKSTSHFLGSTALELTYPNGVRLFSSGDLGSGLLTDELLTAWDGTKPDMLVLDATRAASKTSETISETELPGRFNSLIQSNQQGNWLVDLPVRHLQRLGALAEISTRTHRPLYIPIEMAHYLSAMQDSREQYPEIPAMSDVKIYLTPRGTGKFKDTDYDPQLRRLAFTNEGQLLPNVITTGSMAEILSSDRVTVVVTDPSQIRHLSSAGRINERKQAEGGRTIGRAQPTRFLSASYPRSSEQWGKWITALNNSGVKIDNQSRINISDHIPPAQFQEAVRRIQPKVLIPMHSNDPMQAVALASEVMTDGQIIKHIFRSSFYQYLGKKGLHRVNLNQTV